MGGALHPGTAKSRSGPASGTAPSAAAALADCPELECVRGLLPEPVLAMAARRSAEAGVGADRVLIAAGHIDEEIYVRALALRLGVPFEPLDHRLRKECPLPDDSLIEAGMTGLLPLGPLDDASITIVPVIAGSRSIVTAVRGGSELSRRIRLTTGARLQRFVTSRAAARIGHRACDDFRAGRPEMSAAPRSMVPSKVMALGATAALPVLIAPEATSSIVGAALAFIFLCWAVLRVPSMLMPPVRAVCRRTYSDAELPVYTVIVALYHEVAAVPGLVDAFEALDYPREKLDIKLVLETEDAATINAVRAVRRRLPCEIVIAPRAGPKTKPKALNAALLFARGSFVTVYDAEDRPEPDQLRLALEAFVEGGERLACAQARLTIDNTADSWLTRLFTAEYAGLFDVLLPGFSKWRLPLPLGGSSNHFRTQVLRDVGGWDAYNVTEDADLGMRLARFGYESVVIPSTTYEEAPAHVRPWLRQRTRWFKGWMQTWLVHMRAPRALLRDLGPAGFTAFQLLVGGTVLAALVHGVFVAAVLIDAAVGQRAAVPAWYTATLLAGYLVSAALGLIGLARRNLMASAWVLLLIPVHWILLSLAAWRALFQFLYAPYRWEKTEHGLARTSRRAAQAVRAPMPQTAPSR